MNCAVQAHIIDSKNPVPDSIFMIIIIENQNDSINNCFLFIFILFLRKDCFNFNNLFLQLKNQGKLLNGYRSPSPNCPSGTSSP